MRQGCVLAITAGWVLTLAACGRDGTSPGDRSKLTSGAVRIAVQRIGNAMDANGVVVSFRDRVYRLAPGDTVVVAHVPDGRFRAILSDVTFPCASRRDTLDVIISQGGTQSANFVVECYGEFVFTEWLAPYDDHLVYLDSAGGMRRVSPGQEGGQWMPRWSPDGSKLVYMRITATETDLYVADLQGKVRAISAVPVEGESDASWSPDGNWLVYERADASSGLIWNSGLRVVRADGTEDHAILPAGRLDLAPAWSPDGTWIAFACWRPRMSICLVHPDGSGLYVSPLSVEAPQALRWSPDGSRIAFETIGSSGQFIQVVRVNDWSLTNLTPGTTGWAFAWSPDGSALAVATVGGDSTPVSVVNREGTGLRQLARNIRWLGGWSADGAKLAIGLLPNAVTLVDVDEQTVRHLPLSTDTALNVTWRPTRGARPPASISLRANSAGPPARRANAAADATHEHCGYRATFERAVVAYRPVCQTAR